MVVRAVRRSQNDSRTLDDTWGGMRKVHVFPTPRIGGFAVAAGLWMGAFVCSFLDAECDGLALLVACAAPAFVWGLSRTSPSAAPSPCATR